jgi:hypothetical protein
VSNYLIGLSQLNIGPTVSQIKLTTDEISEELQDLAQSQ